MQTFLPHRSFAESAKTLDRKRLGKQRVEAWQIVRALRGETKGWRNHPATKMWEGYVGALCVYGMLVCQEWSRRGYKDSLYGRFVSLLVDPDLPLDWPPWIGEEAFHASHRSNLLRKDPAHYAQFGWKESADLPYVWPKLQLRMEE